MILINIHFFPIYDTTGTTQTGFYRTAMDPYIFDLMNAIEYIDEFGQKLETLIWLVDGVDTTGEKVVKLPGRSDMCECERLHKCPNGTASVAGSTSWMDCQVQ